MQILHYVGDRIAELPPESLADALTLKDGALWVDMTGPTPEEQGALVEVFKFHPLAIEDTLKQAQRPKLEAYEGYFFMTLHAVRPLAQRGVSVTLQEVDLFFSPRYVVTVHPHPVPAIEEARSRLGKASAVQRVNADYVLYAVVDSIVDTYFPIIDRLDASLDRLEDHLFRQPTPRALDQLFHIKRSLLSLRRASTPLRDIFNVLTRHDSEMVRPQTLVYYRDVYDHLLRITDLVDTHRDLLTGAMEIYLSIISNRLNEVVKVLTVITALLGAAAVITGFFGMNFERTWPPFELRYGALAVAVVIVASWAAALAVFRRLRWL
jgi:magnesium transporter